ncbi:glutathione S-transferase-like [Hylaeus volcanicus]|uniref:glutathione S-transferase-like n=1 Tax=Hylaeus volcanicus TaxID=313075 RepID=UPI0023B7839E|nr:glutathione S-transferase-like [Hylaeus volcanicus]XP_053979679.1 glutathione S-transferase-like [Hylaeus volcanicus]
MTRYKLVYFNVMGLGEPIRFILCYGGVPFEDVRVERDINEWLKIKPTTPFGQLPLLEIDGKVYAQTLPICRYLAKQFNLLGKTDLDNLQIDAIANALHDFRKSVVSNYYREQDPALKAKKKVEVFENTVPFYLNKLEELTKNNGGYLHGGQLSYADLFFVAITDSLSTAYEADITKDKPHLKALKEKVLAIPSIKAYVEKRPKLPF